MRGVRLHEHYIAQEIEYINNQGMETCKIELKLTHLEALKSTQANFEMT